MSGFISVLKSVVYLMIPPVGLPGGVTPFSFLPSVASTLRPGFMMLSDSLGDLEVSQEQCPLTCSLPPPQNWASPDPVGLSHEKQPSQARLPSWNFSEENVFSLVISCVFVFSPLRLSSPEYFR